MFVAALNPHTASPRPGRQGGCWESVQLSFVPPASLRPTVYTRKALGRVWMMM